MSKWADISGMKFPVVTICGSLRYWSDMLQLATHLTVNGMIVLMPFVSDYVGGKPADETKEMLDRMHFAKIDMSEAIYVVGSHIGESTQRELEYAEKHGKLIYYAANPAESPEASLAVISLQDVPGANDATVQPPIPAHIPAGNCVRCANSGVGVCDDYPNCPAGR